MNYPVGLKIGSCRQCPDPQRSGVFVTFEDATKGLLIIVEPLIDKPRNEAADTWLRKVSHETIANPIVTEEKIFIDGRAALRVVNHNPDARETENIYVVNRSRTFAVRGSDIHNKAQYDLYREMLSTFRFDAQ